MSGRSHNKIVMGELSSLNFQNALNNIILLGAMTFGFEGRNGPMIPSLTDVNDVSAVLDIFQKYGHKEVDTARVYR